MIQADARPRSAPSGLLRPRPIVLDHPRPQHEQLRRHMQRSCDREQRRVRRIRALALDLPNALGSKPRRLGERLLRQPQLLPPLAECLAQRRTRFSRRHARTLSAEGACLEELYVCLEVSPPTRCSSVLRIGGPGVNKYPERLDHLPAPGWRKRWRVRAPLSGRTAAASVGVTMRNSASSLRWFWGHSRRAGWGCRVVRARWRLGGSRAWGVRVDRASERRWGLRTAAWARASSTRELVGRRYACGVRPS